MISTRQPSDAQASVIINDASVLVVDDGEDNRDLLRRRLSRLGYAVTEAVDGHDALQKIDADPPDVVLLDHMMPGMSGFDVVGQIRERYRREELPIIMVTAHDDEGLLIKCLGAGANDFVTKPVSFNVLRARMETQLGLRQATLALRNVNDDLESRVAARTATLHQQTETLRRALADAEAGNRAKAKFLSSMSHDLRTPLNAVIGLADILRHMADEKRLSDGPQLIDEIHRNGLYLLSIVSDVLEMSAIEAGRAPPADRTPTDLAGLLSDAVTMARDAHPSGPDLVLDTVDAGCLYPVDAGLVRRAVDNLITNAQKYAGGGDEIVLRLRWEAGAPTIEVQDRGPGLPDAMLARICQPFVTLGVRDAGGRKGVGLGLAIVADIMARHDGRLSIRNAPECGLVASLCFSSHDSARQSL